MLELRLDYATFNFAAGSMSETRVAKILLGQSEIGWRAMGVSENSPLYSPLGLFWLGNSGFAAAPHRLQVSGVGCEKFALTLPELRASAECHFSRLDFAFDVIMSRSEWRQFITYAFSASMNSERQRKKYVLQGSGEAMTIYIGSRKSAKYFRIYNKTLEDPQYEYQVDGKTVPLEGDQCVIRYEVELHRFKRPESVFDPSPLFDWYHDSDKQAELCEYIKNLWLSFGNEILLPADFANAEFCCRYKTKIKILYEKDMQPLEVVHELLHDYPHSFDRSMRYVVEKFGKYIPYIMQDERLRMSCYAACKREFGFVPDDYYEAHVESGFYDLDLIDDDIEDPFAELDYDQLEID